MSFEKLTDKQIVKNVEILLKFWSKRSKYKPSETAGYMVAHLLCVLTSNLDEDKEKLESLK